MLGKQTAFETNCVANRRQCATGRAAREARAAGLGGVRSQPRALRAWRTLFFGILRIFVSDPYLMNDLDVFAPDFDFDLTENNHNSMVEISFQINFTSNIMIR